MYTVLELLIPEGDQNLPITFQLSSYLPSDIKAMSTFSQCFLSDGSTCLDADFTTVSSLIFIYYCVYWVGLVTK